MLHALDLWALCGVYKGNDLSKENAPDLATLPYAHVSDSCYVACSCAAEAATGRIYYEDFAYKLATNGRKV